MTSPAPFGRMLTAMATAFADDGAVDLDATAAIAQHLVDHGHDGVVVSGTTGESPTCTVAETGDILRVVKDAVGDRASVVAGVGSNATAHSPIRPTPAPIRAPAAGLPAAVPMVFAASTRMLSAGS